MALDCIKKIAARKQDPCDSTREYSRVINAALLKKGLWDASISDPDPTTVVNNILAAEQVGDAFILRRTTGSFAETQNTSEGRGKQKEVSTTLDHSVTVFDHEPVRNTGFWDDIKKQADKWDVVFFTQTRGWIDPNQSVNIQSTLTVDDDLDSYAKITGIFNWTSIDHPTPFRYDESLLSAPSTAGDVVLTASGGGTVGGASPEFTYDIADTGNVDLGFSLSSGSEVDSLELLDGETLPAGISIAGGNLVGTATGTGVSTFKLCVVSIYGLETVVTITYTVS